MKYVRKPFKELFGEYGTVMLFALFSTYFSALLLLFGFWGKSNVLVIQVDTLFAGMYLGMAISGYRCAKFHNKQWMSEIVDQAFNEIMTVHEANKIKNQGY